MTSGLVALSSSAILAVYAAGYVRTRPAADRFAVESTQRKAEARPPQLTSEPVARSTPAPPVPNREPAPLPPASATPVPRPVVQAAQTPQPEVVADSAALPATTPETGTGADAPAPVIAQVGPTTEPTPDAALYKDGTYLGWGSCRHGDIQAAVVIENGRITSAAIAQCRTRYSCSWIEALPGQVVSRQSPKVDYVSGASESTDAYYDAVSNALSQAK
jgi:uncharacterized protein with FMN-binding domain